MISDVRHVMVGSVYYHEAGGGRQWLIVINFFIQQVMVGGD